MYKKTVDLNEVYPITTTLGLVNFERHLGKFGEKVFDKEYNHEPTLDRCLQKQSKFENLGLIIGDVDIGKTPADYKYATLYLKVFSSEDDVITVFEHQTGAYCWIKTDRSSLTVIGPDQETVDAYLARLFKPLKKEAEVEDKPPQ